MFSARLRRNVFSTKQDPSQKYTIESKEKPATNNTQYPTRPRFNLSRNTIIPFDSIQYQCKEKFAPTCVNKTNQFGSKIIAELRKSETVSGDALDEPNYYNVDYSPMNRQTGNSSRVLPICLVLAAKVRGLRKKDSPFSTMPLGELFPKKRLFSGWTKDGKTKSCAIVSSAGSMANSGLGHFVGEYKA